MERGVNHGKSRGLPGLNPPSHFTEVSAALNRGYF